MIHLAVITLLTCLALASPALARPTLPFGVRVTAERANDPMIIVLRRSYTRFVLIAAAAAILVALTIQPDVEAIGIALSFVYVGLHYLTYRRVRAVKRKEWWQAEHRYGVTVDTSFRSDPVRMPWLWLTPAVLILAVTAIVGWGRSLEPVVTQAGVTLMAPLLVLLAVRARPEVDAARPKGSARRYRVYLRGFAKMMPILAATINLNVLAIALLQWDLLPRNGFWTVAVYIPLGLGVLAFVIWELKVGQAGHRLPAEHGEKDENTGLAQRDDDRYWYLAGMIYVNRRDPAVLVHQRVGTFWTLNLGHPIAWAIIGVIVTVAALSGLGVIDLPHRQHGF